MSMDVHDGMYAHQGTDFGLLGRVPENQDFPALFEDCALDFNQYMDVLERLAANNPMQNSSLSGGVFGTLSTYPSNYMNSMSLLNAALPGRQVQRGYSPTLHLNADSKSGSANHFLSCDVSPLCSPVNDEVAAQFPTIQARPSEIHVNDTKYPTNESLLLDGHDRKRVKGLDKMGWPVEKQTILTQSGDKGKRRCKHELARTFVCCECSRRLVDHDVIFCPLFSILKE